MKQVRVEMNLSKHSITTDAAWTPRADWTTTLTASDHTVSPTTYTSQHRLTIMTSRHTDQYLSTQLTQRIAKINSN